MNRTVSMLLCVLIISCLCVYVFGSEDDMVKDGSMTYWEDLCRSIDPPDYSILYRDLVGLLSDEDIKGIYSIYIEDLDSGAMIDLNADQKCDAWSLLKLPILVTVLKKIEMGEVDPKKQVLLPDIQVNTYGPEEIKELKGKTTSLDVLLRRIMQLSDNKASFAVASLFKAEEFQHTLLALGITPAAPDLPRNTLPSVSPREFGNVFRNVYHHDYLSEASSQYALALMRETIFDSQIAKGLPSGMALSHKVGFNADVGEFHDCGIVWYPNHPFILCVMSAGSTRGEADRVIAEIARRVVAFYEAGSVPSSVYTDR